MAVPSLASIASTSLTSHVHGLDAAIARCVDQSKELTARKDALLVELGVVSESLEQLHVAKTQLMELKEDVVLDVQECLPPDISISLQRSFENPPPPPPAIIKKPPLNKKANKKSSRASAEVKAERRAAVLPSDDAERAALIRRQIVVRGLPPGTVDESGLSSFLAAALQCVANTPITCERVQLYAGGTYAFVALPTSALAATAVNLPPLSINGQQLTIGRVHGCEGLDADDAIPIPPHLDLSSLTPCTPPPKTSLEERLFWSLRRHSTHPKPAEKEVREAFAFFKKTEKLLGRRTLIIDCCGSHGLVGAIFTAYGRCRRCVVLDLHRPASFDQLRAAWEPWLGPALPSELCVEITEEENGAAAEEEVEAAPSTAAHDEPEGLLYGDGLHFDVGDLHTRLPLILDNAKLPPSEIAVLACHACSHLTDAIIDICVARGIDFACLPCCQRDMLTSNQMALVAKSLKISEHAAIDVARLGGVIARGYDCRWRTIEASITPQNRLIVGLARVSAEAALRRQKVEEASNKKIKQIYQRVHASGTGST